MRSVIKSCFLLLLLLLLLLPEPAMFINLVTQRQPRASRISGIANTALDEVCFCDESDQGACQGVASHHTPNDGRGFAPPLL